MSDSSRDKLFDQIQKDQEEYDAKFIKSSSRTVIHKISIDEDKIEIATDLAYQIHCEVGYLCS